ncbi:MAG: FHA domain-containing protein [Thermoanaerobaculia bacterium]
MPDWTFLLRHREREIPLSEGDTVLGRSRGCGVRIDEESVSRSHALLTIHDDEARIRDLGSSNGLFVNGRRVSQETSLKDGDTVALGSVKLGFVATPPAEIEAKTAMINISAAARPSQSATQFIRPEPQLLEHPIPPAPPDPPLRPQRRERSPDEVVIRPELQEPAAPSRVTAVATSRPGALARLLSGVVDLVVVSMIAAICFAPALLAIVTHASLQERAGGSGLVFWVLLIFCGSVAVAGVCVYFLATLAGRGATFGQRMFRLAVVSEDGVTPKSGAVLARLVGLLLYVATAGLLFLPAAFNRQGLGLADRISGTRVERA